MLTNRLVTRGFLPKELPPLFSSATLGRVVGHPELPPFFKKEKAERTSPVQHDLARPGGLRRRLHIPNPISFFRLASVFDNNQRVLTAEWSKSPFSRTTPVLGLESGRGMVVDVRDRATPRASARVGARYVLHTDIAQFYPSVYTHSVPWVLHTKEVAKARKNDMKLVGNVLDHELRACQHGQTKGIAIGPDTSLGIAELLLSQFDAQIKDKCNVVGGCRFIDDIELTFKRYSDAEEALTLIETLLHDLELQPNALKTAIRDLPVSIESRFASYLRSNLPIRADAPKSQWIDYFNSAFEFASADRAAGSLRYAVAALSGVRPSDACWDLAQRLVWQCVSLDPGCIRHVVDFIAANRRLEGKVSDPDVAVAAVDSGIQSSATVGHASEVVWAIWAAMYVGFPIGQKSQDAIAEMDDDLVASIAMFAAETKAVFSQPFVSRRWRSWLQQDCFLGEHWLFAYEAYRRDWFPEEVSASQISKDRHAAFLRSIDVTFLVENACTEYVPKAASIGGGGLSGGFY